MVIQRAVAAIRLAQAGILQGLVAVDEAGPKAPAVAQEVAVDLGIEAVVDALQAAVAFPGHGVATHGATGAYGGCGLQVPFTGVVVYQ